MFFWKSQKRVDERLAQIDAKIADSFARVKQDNSAIYQWLDFFYEEANKQKSLTRHHQEQIHGLRQEIAALNSAPRSREDVKAIVDSCYDFKGMMERIRQISEKISHIESVKAAAPAPVRHVVFREEPVASRPVSAIREKMMKRIARNSKDYIKSMIVSLIRKYSRISAMALREIVVDEQGLCSKSSFYRILEDIEKEGSTAVISSGREKVYVSELSSKARK